MRAWIRPFVSAVLGTVHGLISFTAGAQSFADIPRGAESRQGVREGLEQAQSYWAATTARTFLGAVFELGTFSLRPELNLGYGKPHFAWAGVSSWSRLTPGGVGFYAGPRLHLPHFSLATGARYQSSVEQRFVLPREVFDRDAIDSQALSRSRFLAWDSELYVDGDAPLGRASLLVTLHGIFGVPKDYLVFEDTLRIVIMPPFAWRTRFAYQVNVGDFESMAIGAVTELLGSPGRDFMTARVGPVVSVALTHHLQATAVATFVVAGRDRLGLAGADLGQIGLRYRWATGDRWAEFP